MAPDERRRQATSTDALERRMDYSAEELRAILAAYQLVAAASWPDLNPTMKSRAARWATASAAELKSELDGTDDFDKRLPWRHQAAKYRRDDEGVVKSGKANLDIIERQESGNGETSWVRVGKAPIKLANGTSIGVLGMYEVVDAATGRSLFMKSMKGEPTK